MNKKLIELSDKLIAELIKNKDQKSLDLYSSILDEMSKIITKIKNI